MFRLARNGAYYIAHGRAQAKGEPGRLLIRGARARIGL